ncbi:unnamed protein product [Thlaspi arvense]|uniref:Bifunctional inhibitor/plant lipid transfer protein/seed storage helical domain-containing protein n=1 Tax=Thlaspi arvense TaxID=13288 RepID=A0AAU9SK11_THLAR|nr:unnamed protein product [Thlaspi arvense]
MEICKLFAVVFVSVVLYSIQATAQGGDGDVAGCLQKLLPCQPYILKVNPPPPSSCCGPMKELVDKDAVCLCTVFNNPEILQKLNLTKDKALDLPKACGVNPDVSKCSKIATSSPPPPASPGSTSGGSSVQAVSFIGLVFAAAFVARNLF